MTRRLAYAVSSLVLVCAPLATGAAQATFDATKLVASRDSLVAFAGPTQLGTAVVSLAREGDNYHFVLDIALSAAAVKQRYDGVFSATTLMPVSGTLKGDIQGMPFNSQ